MNPILEYILTAVAAFAASALLTPAVMGVSRRFNLLDMPDSRKKHAMPVSRLGGAAIFVSFAATAAVLLGLGRIKLRATVRPPLFFTAMTLSFLLGLMDDLFHIKARYKLVFQALIAALASFSGLLISRFFFFDLFRIDFGYFSHVITVIWIILFMNAINLIDGMDGLASGILVIASSFVAVVSLLMGNTATAFLSLALLGAVGGFYIFNFPPARIFMGDSGAYFLGFIFATTGLLGLKKTSVAVVFLVPIVLLLIPVLDALRVVFKRAKERKSIFSADNAHIHFRLLDIGLTTKNILFILYVLTVILGMFAVLIVLLPVQYSFILFFLIFLVVLFSFSLINIFEKQTINKKYRGGKPEK
jgi:UDP-GlcNAc:undecaprenyl-phosphate/decaprenyl-phosphate GlcNAc-1-phosphate transferase